MRDCNDMFNDVLDDIIIALTHYHVGRQRRALPYFRSLERTLAGYSFHGEAKAARSLWELPGSAKDASELCDIILDNIRYELGKEGIHY